MIAARKGTETGLQSGNPTQQPASSIVETLRLSEAGETVTLRAAGLRDLQIPGTFRRALSAAQWFESHLQGQRSRFLALQ
jgi:hypothetical protein